MNKEPCERCKGEGTVPKNIPGNEGVPEMDVEVDCPNCGGSGKQEDAEAEEREWQALDDNMDWMSDDQIEQSARQIREKYSIKEAEMSQQ